MATALRNEALESIEIPPAESVRQTWSETVQQTLSWGNSSRFLKKVKTYCEKSLGCHRERRKPGFA